MMSVELAFHREGVASGDAPPIVFLGSLGSDHTMWSPQLTDLASDHDVVAVDLRGHGRSPAPNGPYSVGDLAGDVLALLDRLGLTRVHVVGLSLGGAVAQHLAITSPDTVATLTLLCTSARFGDPANWTDRAAAVRADGIGSIADAIVDRWFTSAHAERDPALVARMRQMVSQTGDEGYAACCEALAQWDSRGDLDRIEAPTLVIGGVDDPATPPEHQQLLATSIAGARLQILSPAAHLANLEQADEVTSSIRAHIAGAS